MSIPDFSVTFVGLQVLFPDFKHFGHNLPVTVFWRWCDVWLNVTYCLCHVSNTRVSVALGRISRRSNATTSMGRPH